MPGVFEAARVSDHVYWVGAIDWAIRDFHGYSTKQGTTYNAFLVMADKITLIDTVKAPFVGEMLDRVASVVEPGRIDYIVSNHAEPDHSSGLPETIDRVRPEKVFASVLGTKALAEHYSQLREIIAVKDGEGLSLRNLDLTFIETRMVHWPDSMMTYLAADELLFAQDGFGMHLASSHRFADEVDRDVLTYETKKYYANILLPYSPLITKLLRKVQGLGVSIKIIAPDHGPIWREPADLETILGWYAEWAEQKPGKKAVIVYDTMWGSTARMARALQEGMGKGGIRCEVMPLGSCHRSDVMTEVLDAGALLVGSPTLNNNVFPTVVDFLTYAKGLKPQNLVGQAFGSFGWSGEAVRLIANELGAMKVTPVGEPIQVKYVPDDALLDQCRSLGVRVAEELKERGNG